MSLQFNLCFKAVMAANSLAHQLYDSSEGETCHTNKKKTQTKANKQNHKHNMYHTNQYYLGNVLLLLPIIFILHCLGIYKYKI